MTHTSAQGWQPGRTLALALGLLLIGGLSVGLLPSALAQKPAKPDQGAPPETAKGQPAVAKNTNMGEVVKIINDKLEASWKENKLQPSDPCSDHEFIRRVSLDIIGRIARPEEIDRFLKDPKDTRRALLIDRLLKTEEYAEYWGHLWSNWLLTRSGPFGRGKYHEQTHAWLSLQFSVNEKYDKIVRELVTATGKNSDNGAVNFILAHLGEPIPPNKRSEEGHFEMVPITSRISKLFLGIQTQCTQCHDHPFDARLKQQHFWGINAFLRQVKRDGAPGMRRRDPNQDLTLSDDTNVNTAGKVFFEKRNGVILQTKAVFLDGTKLPPDANRREKLADLIVQHDNFPKAYVNRLWAHFFGRGFTNPVDDFNEQNTVSHPELLDELGKKFKHYGYNQKDLIRWICNSNAYNLKSVANSTNDKADAEPFFSRMLMKTMSLEQLFESLLVATLPEKPTTPEAKAARKALREQWMTSLISNFGDDEGNEVAFQGTIVQALMMMNGQEINNAINNKDGTVAKMMARPGTAAQYITHLYLVTLNRPPVQTKEMDEVKIIFSKLPFTEQSRVKGVTDKRESPYQDLMWALLNSNEFLLNH